MSRAGLSSFRAATASRHHHSRRGAMSSDHPHFETSGRTRNDQIAALHRTHAGALRRRVAWRSRADPQTVEDACSHAWLQLLTDPSVDLASPDWSVLGWLTLTATREARRLLRRRVREGPIDLTTIEYERRLRGPLGPAPTSSPTSTTAWTSSHRSPTARDAFCCSWRSATATARSPRTRTRA